MNLFCVIFGHKWFVKTQTEKFKSNKTIRTKVKEMECARCGLKKR